MRTALWQCQMKNMTEIGWHWDQAILQLGSTDMSKAQKVGKAVSGKPEHTIPKAVQTSMQPYHFTAALAHSLQDYNQKTLNFVTKRLSENLDSATRIASAGDPDTLFRESSKWWETMGRDYFAHFADVLDLSKEVQSEVADLVETETAISKAKPQDMFDNSPV